MNEADKLYFNETLLLLLIVHRGARSLESDEWARGFVEREGAASADEVQALIVARLNVMLDMLK